MNRLSIITPTLDAERYLSDFLASVAGCAERLDIEHIVVDGGSRDRTIEILEKHGDVVRLSVEPGVNRVAAMNVGMQQATGDFICWLDADDLLDSAGVAEAVKHLSNASAIDVVYGAATVLDEDGNAYRRRTPRKFSRDRISRKNILLPPAVVFRANVLNSGARLDPQLKHHSDYDFWLNLVEQGCRFKRLSATIGGKRRHRGNRYAFATEPDEIREAAEELLRVAQSRLPHPSTGAALIYGESLALCEGVTRVEPDGFDRKVLAYARTAWSEWFDANSAAPGWPLWRAHVLRELQWLLRRPIMATRFLPRRAASIVRSLFDRRVFKLHHHEPRILRLPESYYDCGTTRGASRPSQISIITPNYNQAAFLEATILSVTDQGDSNTELIIQDGASDDGSVDILRHHASADVSYESAPDCGQADAINRGMNRATGDILAYLNSDDLLLPGSLAYVRSFFDENADVDVIYGDRILIDEQGLEIGRWVLPEHDDEAIRWADFIPQETLFWRRSAWEAVGGRLDESFEFAMDWDLIVRFRAAGMKFRHVSRLLGAFRVTENQKTHRLMETVGRTEMNRIRLREFGRIPTERQIRRAVKPFIRRQWIAQLQSTLRAA